jgi:Rod binding domain-containing protein
MNFSRAGMPGAAPASPISPAGANLKARNAAQQFEAVLITSLLESLQKSFADTTGETSSGNDNYGAMGTQALATAMSAHGGFGIARMILHQWQQTKVPELEGTGGAPRS